MAADALANLFYTSTTKCSSPAPQYTVSTSHNNQFTGTGISYDSDGDMTQDTAFTYTYDAENRIITASGMSGGPYCYTYDGNGLRVMKAHASGGSCTGTVTVDMLYWRNVAGNTIAETDGSGSTTNSSYNEYIFFAGRRIAQSNPSSSAVYFYFVDHLGSTRVVTNAAGSACYEADFLPYGTENTPSGFSNSCSTSYKFTGYERDAETAYGTSSGNDYAFARYFNARLGRFMSGDPLDGDISDPQTLNKYAYVRNNPVNLIDPTGSCGQEPNDPCPPQPNPWGGNWYIPPMPPVPIGCSMGGTGFGESCSPVFGPNAPPIEPSKVKPGPGKPPKCPSKFAQAAALLLLNANDALHQALTSATLVAQLSGHAAVVAVSGSASISLWDAGTLSGALSVGIAVDPSGNIGLAISTRGGGGFSGLPSGGTSAAATVNVSWTKQNSIVGLNGNSPVMGFTVGDGDLAVSASRTASGTTTVGAGTGGGFSTFGGVNGTKVIPLVCAQ